MKKKLSIFILLWVCSMQLNAQDFYVWADQLNVRKTPAGKVIEKLPWGSEIRIIERFTSKKTDTLHLNLEYKYWLKGKDTIMNRPFSIWGKWIKIETKKGIGYIFDAYLSKIPPPKLISIEQVKFELLEEYFEREFGISSEEKIGCKTCDDNYRHLISKDKSIEYLGGWKGKEGINQFIFHNLSLKEAKLIGFQLFKDRLGGGCGFSVHETKNKEKVIVERFCSC